MEGGFCKSVFNFRCTFTSFHPWETPAAVHSRAAPITVFAATLLIPSTTWSQGLRFSTESSSLSSANRDTVPITASAPFSVNIRGMVLARTLPTRLAPVTIATCSAISPWRLADAADAWATTMALVTAPPAIPVAAPITPPTTACPTACLQVICSPSTNFRPASEAIEAATPPVAPVATPTPMYWPAVMAADSKAALPRPVIAAVNPAAAPPVAAPPRKPMPAFISHSLARHSSTMARWFKVCWKDCNPPPMSPPPKTAPIATSAGAANPAVQTVRPIPKAVITNDAAIIHILFL